MTFDLPPVRLVADFRALAMGIKPKCAVALLQSRFPRNLRDPDVSIVNPDGKTGTDNSLAPGGPPTTEGSKPRATRWYRLVKKSNGSRRTAGSRSVP